MQTLSIGTVAKESGFSVETVRYYEREGLIPAAVRSASGYRKYSPETIRRLQFIRRAKAVGFTLRDIRELLTLRTDPGASCADVKRRALLKIRDVEARIRALEAVRAALATLADACQDADAPTSACPILDALDANERRGDARG